MMPARIAEADNNTVMMGRRMHSSERFIALTSCGLQIRPAETICSSGVSTRWLGSGLDGTRLRYSAARTEILGPLRDYMHPGSNGLSLYYCNPFLYQAHLDRKRLYLSGFVQYIQEFSFRSILHGLHRHRESMAQSLRRERHHDKHARPQVPVRIRKLCLETNCTACRIDGIIDKYQTTGSCLFL